MKKQPARYVLAAFLCASRLSASLHTALALKGGGVDVF
jgi:hypothetical protein